jgi:ATP-binding cassette subfamily B protein/subfamily B ATP-binding cassette protein MsbA
MIRDAPVLLLDEPTTGLDAASGQRVLAPLRRLMAGRTTIIISHDLLTVTDADAIIVLEAGAVSAVGTHEQLLAASPTYAQLHALHHPGSRVAAAPARGSYNVPRAPQPGPAPARGVAAQAGRVRRGPPDATVPLPAVARRPPPAAMPRMPFAAPRPTRPAPAPPSTAGSSPRHRADPVEVATEALPVPPAAPRPPARHREVSPDPVRARATT